MKRTEKYIDSILKDLTKDKKELNNLAIELLIGYFYEAIMPKILDRNFGFAQCVPLSDDVKERIYLFLEKEGYKYDK